MIRLAPGVHRIESTVVVDREKLARDASITIEGPDAVLSGGVPLLDWKALPNGLWQCEVRDGSWSFRQLWVNGRRAIRARHPNDGWLRVEKVGEDRRTHFLYAGEDLDAIDTTPGMELVFLHDWSISRVPVRSIDHASKTLTVEHQVGGPSRWAAMDWFEKQPRYFLENATAFLDAPGEWYLNETSGVLTYYPRQGERIATAEIVAPRVGTLLRIVGKNGGDVTVKDLTLEHSAWSAPDDVYWGRQACTYWTPSDKGPHVEADPAAVQLDRTDGCRLVNLVVRHVGPSGIWAGSRCSNIEIDGCTIQDVGGNGVNIGEGQVRAVDGKSWWESAPEQATKHVVLRNCDISHCGVELYGAVGVWIGLANNTRIEGNHIHDLPYTGVSVGWMWWDPRSRPEPRETPCFANRIEGNHIHHVMQTLSDGGGIYCLGIQPNSRIARNVIHDIPLNAGRAESNGMFLDQGTGAFTIEENLIYNVERSPFRFHKGWENVVQNNLFVLPDGVPPVRYNDTVESRITLSNDRAIAPSDVDAEAKRLLGD